MRPVEQALTLLRELLGEDHAEVADAEFKVGAVLLARGKREDAEAELSAALRELGREIRVIRNSARTEEDEEPTEEPDPAEG